MATKSIPAGNAFLRLTLDDAAFRRGLNNVAKRLNALGRSVAAAGRSFLRLGAGIAAPLAAAAVVFAKTGDAIDKFSARTGIAADQASLFQFAAEQTGTGLEVFEKGIAALARALRGLEQNLATQTRAFEDLGIAADDILGQDPLDQFKLVAKRLAAIEDPTRRAGIALEVLGRAGRQLTPLLSSFDELTDQAERFGLTIDQKTAAAAAELTDTLNLLRRIATRTAVAIGAALAPTLISVGLSLAGAAKEAIAWVDANRGLIRSIALVAAGVTIAGSALIAFGVTSLILGAAFSGLATVVGAIGTAFSVMTSSISLTVIGIAGLIGAFLKFTEIGRAVVATYVRGFTFLAATVSTTFQGIKNALAAGDIAAAARVLMAGLRVVFTRGVEEIKKLWAPVGEFINSVWAAAVSGVVQVMHGLAKAWLVVTVGIQSAWAIATTAIQNGWATAQNFVTTGVLKLQKKINESLTDEPFDISVELSQADKALAKTKKKLEADKNATLQDLGAQFEQENKQLGAARDAVLETLRAKEVQRQKEAAASLERAEQAAGEARNELDRLAAGAKAAAEAAPDGAGSSFREQLDSLLDDLTGAVNTVTTRGTFRGATAALELNAGPDVAKQQLAAAIQQVNEIKGLRDDQKKNRGIPVK